VPLCRSLPGFNSEKHAQNERAPMQNLAEKFRGVIPKNHRRHEPKHPDFSGSFTIWNSVFRCGAWINSKADGEHFIALRLSSDGGTQSEKLKFTLWKNKERSAESDPLFRSTQSAYDHEFTLKAWITPPPASGHFKCSEQKPPSKHRCLRIGANPGWRRNK
jgi:hypothetical protein